MLFYGDIDRLELPSTLRRSIARSLRRAIAVAPGVRRHQLLVTTFIEAGELVQGLADQDFDRVGADDVSDLRAAGSRLLLALASAVKVSWDQNFTGALPVPADWMSTLKELDGPEPVRLKRGEGYAFYCLYPENYLDAARKSGLGPNTVVIGLRSIGASLAALVAAAIGSRRLYNLRPVGPPFERRLAIAPALERRLLDDSMADFAVVDEGPGLSGSSFGCVGDWLIAHGVEPGRIHLFPSHGGDLGLRAGDGHRKRWNSWPRHVVGADETILACDRPNALSHRAAKLTGERVQTWQEISGGGWRAHHYLRAEAWPPVHASMERRKFLMHTDDHAWLVKFAGLDAQASGRLRARALLAEAGYVPPLMGETYGFAVEEWIDAKPICASDSGNDDIVDAVEDYLGFRARHLPPPHRGASLSDLCAMAVHNTTEALGPAAGDRLRKRISGADRIARRCRRTDTDNRMHRWEWLVLPGGRVMKTDAVDHNAAHDFVGCQDIAWDIAGATVEFGLSDQGRDRLAEGLAARADVELDREKLRMFEYCYLAFQIGLWTYAGAAAGAEERPRIDRVLGRYRSRLAMLLQR